MIVFGGTLILISYIFVPIAVYEVDQHTGKIVECPITRDSNWSYEPWYTHKSRGLIFIYKIDSSFPFTSTPYIDFTCYLTYVFIKLVTIFWTELDQCIGINREDFLKSFSMCGCTFGWHSSIPST